jgi:surface protein
MSTIYTLNGKVLKNSANDKWLIKKVGLPPIAANTIRVRTSDGNVPVKTGYTYYDTATLVSGTTDVYDVYKSGTNFWAVLYNSTNVVEVLGANITGVTDISDMFGDCTSLTTISLFDTSSVTNMNRTFSGCTNVQSGALALYQQASSQTTPPTLHTGTFHNCGSDTVTGAAELAQIPSSWK